jgi:hypothetical protein
MKHLNLKLQLLFPDIRIGSGHDSKDCVISNTGIVEWHRSEPQPTDRELASVARLAYDQSNLAEILHSRRKEYPTWGEIHHAQLDGGMDEINARRQAVKEKYPKPDLYDPEVLYPRGSEYAAIIAGGIVADIVSWSEGIESSVKITDEIRDYLGAMPGLSDTFATVGGEYSIPPGTFISSNEG